MHGRNIEINKYTFRQTQPFVVLTNTAGIDQKIIIFMYYITEVLKECKLISNIR